MVKELKSMEDLNLSDFYEQIRSLLDTKLDKLEVDIKASIQEIKTKIDDLNVKHSESNERLTAAESKVQNCEVARIDQGRRLGELEREISSFKVEILTEKRVREKMGEGAKGWVQWVPSLIFGLLGAFALILSLVKGVN